MKIATFNINGIKARLPRLLEWLTETRPAVACLQEIKSQDEGFPAADFEALGYAAIWHGQKSFNGVAILVDTRAGYTLTEVQRGLGIPGPNTNQDGGDEEQARYLEADVSGVRIACLYLPNGNPAPGPKYDYKLGWMDRLAAHAASLLKSEDPFILCGDYNIIPTDEDCWDPTVWTGDALTLPQGRAAFRRLKHLGLTEAFEASDNRAHQYTFWDYQGGAFPKDHGIRIDHHLLSPQAADRLQSIEIYRKAREKDKPSDHVPVIATFSD